ncbi:hypothetical protein MHI22_07535 [Lysinibacillus sp. FSL L8-0312]|uniref:hypothetical protein n=1 Tax=Lysinibacillus sp. FSL L8-0312 TaxID=2921521 RepID=UPI0030F82AD4
MEIDSFGLARAPSQVLLETEKGQEINYQDFKLTMLLQLIHRKHINPSLTLSVWGD